VSDERTEGGGLIGQTVGNFEITSQLGKGGMGAVYVAQHRSIKTRVAIKVLHPDVSTNTVHVQRFHQEAIAVGQIPHSGIVRIFDHGTLPNGQAYLVMEHLEGETLTRRIQKRGRLSMGEVADYGRQLASVLDATHNANITHRDLKPDNVYLVRDAELARGERVKVLDFGIAKLQPPDAGPRMTSVHQSSIGTPAYMSPEQWHSLGEVDWRTDAYALGCVVFEMACGRPPFLGDSMAELCAQHLGDPPPAPSSIVPGLPKQLDELIARLLDKEPAGRPTMREVMAVFVELGHDEGIGLSTLPPNKMKPFVAPPAVNDTAVQPSVAAGTVHAEPPKRPRRAALLLALGALVIVGTAAAAIVVTSQRSSSGSDDPEIATASKPSKPAGGAELDRPITSSDDPAATDAGGSIAIADASVDPVAVVDAAPATARDPGPATAAFENLSEAEKPVRRPPPDATTRPPAGRDKAGVGSAGQRTPASGPTELAAAVIRDRIAERHAALDACTQGRVSGQVVLEVAVDPRGKAKLAGVQGLRDNRIRKCFEREVESLRFPATSKGGRGRWSATYRADEPDDSPPYGGYGDGY
jgi:serine/threonine protein kinase